MNHPIHRVVAYDIAGPYVLHVRFEDGVERTIDLAPVLAGELFGPLRDRVMFERVELDPEASTLVWPNGADFDPATLYDWPLYADELAARAKQWQLAPTP
jgi:hypothetical protein